MECLIGESGDPSVKRALRWSNLGLVFAAALLSLFGVEYCLRLWYPVQSTLYMLDDRLLFRLLPGGRKRFVQHPGNGGEAFQIRIDEAGFRTAGRRPATTGRRVIVYGDSFIAGEFSRYEDTFVARLEGLLQDSSELREAQVINAGVVGYGPDQIALRMEKELRQLRPALVIVAVFSGNDFGDLVRNKLFSLGAGGELVEQHPRLSETLRQEFIEALRKTRRPAIVRLVGRATEKLRDKIAAWGQPPHPPAQETYIADAISRRRDENMQQGDPANGIVDNLFRDTYDIDLNLSPDTESSRRKIALMAAVLGRIDRTCRENRVPWLLVIIPDPIDVALDYDLRVDRNAFPGYDPARLTGLLATIAQERGFAFVDLSPTLRERPGEKYFFRFGDNHWNTAGQSRAAQAVGREIIRLKLLDTSR
jgi:lysophospholipase L1-like esterase